MSSVAHIKREAGVNDGIPVVATPSRYTAPVHIDVGGKIYTSSLDTLTKYPDSKLSKMFSGSIPIVLDTLKQHYFIDRDGGMFRHILNFMRTGRPCLPDNFDQHDLLLEEAKYYELTDLVNHLVNLQQKSHHQSSINGVSNHISRENHSTNCNNADKKYPGNWDVIALHVSPEMGERIMISGSRDTLEELFPELSHTLQDTRHTLAWNSTLASKYVIRFPLNGYCKVTTMQVMTQLLNNNFELKASNGGGVEGQQFSEYVFIRQLLPQ